MKNSSEYTRQYREKNKKALSLKRKQYYLNNKTKETQYILAHRDEIKARQIKWKNEWQRLFEEWGWAHCSVCGYSKCFAAIDFHHKNPDEKEANIATLIQRKPSPIQIQKVKAEVSKTISLCCRCHRELHWGSNFK